MSSSTFFMDMIIITKMRQLDNKFIYTCYDTLTFLKLKQALQRYAYIINASKKSGEQIT